jgi:hypothetical protein
MAGQAPVRQEAFNAHFVRWRAAILIDRVHILIDRADILIDEGLTGVTTSVNFA